MSLFWDMVPKPLLLPFIGAQSIGKSDHKYPKVTDKCRVWIFSSLNKIGCHAAYTKSDQDECIHIFNL